MKTYTIRVTKSWHAQSEAVITVKALDEDEAYERAQDLVEKDLPDDSGEAIGWNPQEVMPSDETHDY